MQTTAVVQCGRAASVRSSHPFASARAQPGSTANLRGFTAGTAVGDTLVAGSLELRIPLTSALSVGKMGVSAFADMGAAYDTGTRLDQQTMRWGLGGSVWFAAAFARVNAGV